MKRDNIDLFGFVDESGTAGAQINKDEYLTLSLVLFDNKEEVKSVYEKYNILRKEMGRKETYEFHYTHNKPATREKVFDILKDINFEFATFSIKKDKTKGHASYATLAVMMTDFLIKKNCATKVLIDTNPVLLKELNKIKKAKKLKNMRFREGESVKIDCLQLVDYVVGAHSRLIRGQTEDNFKKIQKKLRLLQICNYD
ncbi:DUF3800 domain-containing protein [Candidatus Saccharibacteria bacterium]|nr:DUF3800 domain-containing protein [Candidatus Saccharibacteria bacterium]